MKKIIILAALALTVLIGKAPAATVTVTVVDDGVSNIGAVGTFYWALTNANPGDTIAFNIPEPGPHYLQVPGTNGFPLIYQKNNLTIDGYTQPGSARNTNSITSSNSAIIKIVIDGRNGIATEMEYTKYSPTNIISDPPINNEFMATERGGYTSLDESALLGVYRSTNVNIKGLAFLGSFGGPNGSIQKGICFAHDFYTNNTVVANTPANYGFYEGGSDAYGHVNGCWFGVDPTNQTVAGVAGWQMAVTGYRHRGRSSGDTRPELPNIGLTVGVKAGSANPRAEYNVFVGCGYAMDAENVRTRISGNFFGVMPDGKTPYNMLVEHPAGFNSAQFELGRYNDTQPVIIGTDGDGVNDADEGNLFGPMALNGASQLFQIEYFTSARKPFIMAGNRFGIGVDGTVWTNSTFQIINSISINNGTQFRFGSDFNGVSDNLEANIVYNNNVFTDVWPTPTFSSAPSLFQVMNNNAAVDGWFSSRGNKLVNCFPIYNPDHSASAGNYTNTWNKFFPPGGDRVPVLSNSTVSTLVGNCDSPTNSYTNLIVDVYLPDPESQTNGATFEYPFFGGAGGWGFVNGRTHLGAFLDNGPYDSNPAVGAFSFNISGLHLTAGTKVTVAVTYSQFARPILAAPVVSGGNATLSWTGDNGGPFSTAGQGGPSSGFGVQRASSLTGPWTTTFAATNGAVVPAIGGISFYRIVAPISGMTTLCAPPVVLGP